MRKEERAGNERGSYRKSGDAFIVLQVPAYTRLMFSWFSVLSEGESWHPFNYKPRMCK